MTIAKKCVGVSLVLGLLWGVIGCGGDDDTGDSYSSTNLSKEQEQRFRDAMSRLDTLKKGLEAAECPCLVDMDGQLCKQNPASCYLNEEQCAAEHDKLYGGDPPIYCLLDRVAYYYEETINYINCQADATEKYIECLSAREAGCGYNPTFACVTEVRKQLDQCHLSEAAYKFWNACW